MKLLLMKEKESFRCPMEIGEKYFYITRGTVFLLPQLIQEECFQKEEMGS